MQSYPDLDAIIAPTSVGIVAAAQAVVDAGKVGEINVTGLGLPSEMAGAIESGASKSFAIWNPIDLGYSAAMIAHALATGTATAEPGGAIPMGRMGEVTLDDTNSGAMADPFVYDARTSTISSRSSDTSPTAPAPLRAGVPCRRDLTMLMQSQSETSTVPEAGTAPVLALDGITKIFPGVKALSKSRSACSPVRSLPLLAKTAPASPRS